MQQGTAKAEIHPTADVCVVRRTLLEWYRAQRRDLPWRRTADPYAIWVSETMLQQTRVASVLPYYARFLQRFPTVRALADAPEAELLACWAGLGYYTRARNMQRAAKAMAGGFPDTYAGIRALPGVGDYTAAAVASIAFGLPHGVVDGNVLRVLSRFYADATDVGTATGKKQFVELAGDLLDRDQPGDFNQAVMELGATVCTPKNPQCLVCPVAVHCAARRSGRQAEFPVKSAMKKQVCEERTVYWIESAGKLLLWQRGPEQRLMAGFWELPERGQLPDAAPGTVIGEFRHSITFHNYCFKVVTAETDSDKCSGCEWVPISKLETMAVSTVLRKAVRVVRQAPGLARSSFVR